MSKVAIQGAATGTGVFTLASPATNTDRTLTLPDEAGTVLTSGTAASNIPGYGSQITEADIWRLTTDYTTSATLSTLERIDTGNSGLIGSGMSESSGVFTFPSTGIWLILSNALIISQSDNSTLVHTQVTVDNGSNWNSVAYCEGGNSDTTFAARVTASSQCFVDVTDTSNIKVRFTAASVGVSSSILGSTNSTFTAFSFIRLGDT